MRTKEITVNAEKSHKKSTLLSNLFSFLLSVGVLNVSCQQAINKPDSVPGVEVVALQLLPLNPENSTPI